MWIYKWVKRVLWCNQSKGRKRGQQVFKLEEGVILTD